MAYSNDYDYGYNPTRTGSTGMERMSIQDKLAAIKNNLSKLSSNLGQSPLKSDNDDMDSLYSQSNNELDSPASSLNSYYSSNMNSPNMSTNISQNNSMIYTSNPIKILASIPDTKEINIDESKVNKNKSNNNNNNNNINNKNNINNNKIYNTKHVSNLSTDIDRLKQELDTPYDSEGSLDSASITDGSIDSKNDELEQMFTKPPGMATPNNSLAHAQEVTKSLNQYINSPTYVNSKAFNNNNLTIDRTQSEEESYDTDGNTIDGDSDTDDASSTGDTDGTSDTDDSDCTTDSEINNNLGNKLSPISNAINPKIMNGLKGKKIELKITGIPSDVSKQTDIDKAIYCLLTTQLKKSNYLNSIAGCLREKEIEAIILSAKNIILKQDMLLEIEAPIKIVGDIHGQYLDLVRLFELGGLPPISSYLFLGDYIDRGKYSLECITLLLCYKIKFPNKFYILRGNHECSSINRLYGFYDECKRRFPKDGIRLWKTFTDVFNCFPVAATIDERILCMHGGLSPEIKTLKQILRIHRPTDIPDSGLLCDLLWSDPDRDVKGWGENDRGVSYTFGEDILAKFLKKQDLDLVCRAHQVVEDGYEFFGSRKLVTIFSAPNYCGEFDNAGAMMGVDDSLMCSFHILKPNLNRQSRFY